MKRNNKKGFTLIELLAVIVILAIIALIAVPIVINVIEKAKEESYKRSVEFAIDAAELYLVENGLSEIPSEGIDVKKLKLKNNNFESGKIVNKDGQVVAENLSNGEYCASGEKGSITISKGNCEEEIVDEGPAPAKPIITNGLVPVKIADDGTVTKANTEEEWYDYSKQKWANAVILTDNATYTDGQTIPEEKIRAYFVWIPRYKYQIFNVETTTVSPKEIKIEFQSMDDDEEKGTENGQWLTHPVFTILGVSGIWVGKFEVGYNQSNNANGEITIDDTWTTEGAQNAESYTTELLKKIIVKPNVYSWRNQKLNTFFQTLYYFNRELDSHMMKNTEWGAVAYLSHSKYGKYGNIKYTMAEEKEIYINNCKNMITGIAGDSASADSTSDCINTYDTLNGQKASTTGNITGVYDMSGGTWEYVAGYNQNLDNTRLEYGGFTSEPITQYSELRKYFDVYESSNSSIDYSRRILGDATAETREWYGDFIRFVYSNNPWFVRGGNYGNKTSAGVFFAYNNYGDANMYYSTRLVLSPSN